MIPPLGTVFLVGAGPGDPGLLTVRGREVLATADLVVYDLLANDRLLDLAPPSAERIFAGKAKGRMTFSQEEINRLLVDHARRGRRVVRLKGGDPFVFGRGAEEAEHLHASGIPFVVVPGVTAGVGVTALAGLPVTHRASSSAVAFVTGHGDPEAAPADAEHPRVDWDALVAFPGTLVIYMGVTRLGDLCRALIRRGKAAGTPAAMVESGTLPRQRTVVATLADLPERVAVAGLGPPALLVVGDVVSRRPALDWFERRPLFGRRIVVTRPAEDSGRSVATLEDLGAEVLVAPTVAIRPVDDFAAVDRAIGRLGEFDWLVFTSSHGVAHFLDRLLATGRDLRALGPVRLAAIGTSTAETLAGYRLRADLVPPTARSESLAEAIRSGPGGGRVLLARADRGRAALVEGLAPFAEVEDLAVYRNVDAEALPAGVVRRVEAGTVDWITVTSPAIVGRLFDLLPVAARRLVGPSIRLASLSPVTSEATRKLGWPVAVEAAEATWDSLVAAIVREEAGR